MKAWLVRERGECLATVVFAETRGKAKVRALATDCCKYLSFCDIETRRLPEADTLYKEGKTETDWFDPEDRLVLVRDCGFTCDEEAFEEEYCATCSARAFCDHATDREEV